MKFYIITAILAAAAFAFYCCCRVAAEADESMAEYLREKEEHKHD